jgi:hypothetical protein
MAYTHIPTNNGRWSGDPGNSVWFPDMESVPLGANDPYKPKTFKELLKLNIAKPITLGISPLKTGMVKLNFSRLASGFLGVRFKNGEPDFSPFAIATVKLDQYLDTRYGSSGTMPLADKLLAKQLGSTEGAVRQWINDNQYVWHERQDGRRIDLLPHDIHGNVPHTGGIALNRERK